MIRKKAGKHWSEPNRKYLIYFFVASVRCRCLPPPPTISGKSPSPRGSDTLTRFSIFRLFRNSEQINRYFYWKYRIYLNRFLSFFCSNGNENQNIYSLNCTDLMSSVVMFLSNKCGNILLYMTIKFFILKYFGINLGGNPCYSDTGDKYI